MKTINTLIVLIFFSSCANIIPPNGGPKDTSAPLLILSSPEDKSLTFSEEKIVFTFDEKIIVKDFYGEFFISPPLSKKVEFSVKSNRLIVQLNQSLKKNTTYFISLGQSVSDLNEGNTINNPSILFSTGKKLDTLYIEGFVSEAISGEKTKNCWLFLHPYLENKNYQNLFEDADFISKTDENGYFSFPNLTNKDYHLVALNDLDNNLNYSLPNEKVGFLDSVKTSSLNIYKVTIFSKNDSLETEVSKIDSSTATGRLVLDSVPENCIVELYNDKGIVYGEGKNNRFVADSIQAGSYMLRLIYDENQNGKWDSGNLENRIQAEKISFYPENIQIRSNWDLELKWKTSK